MNFCQIIFNKSLCYNFSRGHCNVTSLIKRKTYSPFCNAFQHMFFQLFQIRSSTMASTAPIYADSTVITAAVNATNEINQFYFYEVGNLKFGRKFFIT